MSIEQVHKQLQSLFDCNTSGSDIFIRDKYTIIISNVSRLSSSQIACLNITMPEVSYDICSSDINDTGLAIIFTLNRFKHVEFSCLHSAIHFNFACCMREHMEPTQQNDYSCKWHLKSRVKNAFILIKFWLKPKQNLRIKMLLTITILFEMCNAQLYVHSSTISGVMCI